MAGRWKTWYPINPSKILRSHIAITTFAPDFIFGFFLYSRTFKCFLGNFFSSKYPIVTKPLRAGKNNTKNSKKLATHHTHAIKVVIFPKGLKLPPKFAPITIKTPVVRRNFLFFENPMRTVPRIRAVVILFTKGESKNASIHKSQNTYREERFFFAILYSKTSKAFRSCNTSI